MSEYWVPTKSGNKGPFSIDQLEQLVAAGRLPRTMDVIEVTSELQIALDDLLPSPIAASPTPSPPPPPEPPQTPEAPGLRRAPVRGGTRQATARGGSRRPARGTARGSTRGRSSARGKRGRTQVYVPRRGKAPEIIGVLILCFVGCAFVGQALNPTEHSYLGKWKYDMEAMRDLVVQERPPEFAGMSEAEIREALSIQLTVEFTESKMIVSDGVTEDTIMDYRFVTRDGRRVLLQVTMPDGTKDALGMIVHRSKLRFPFPAAPGGHIVLRK